MIEGPTGVQEAGNGVQGWAGHGGWKGLFIEITVC